MPLTPNASVVVSLGSFALDQPSGGLILGLLGVLVAVVVFCVWMAVLLVFGIVAAVRRHKRKKQAAARRAQAD